MSIKKTVYEISEKLSEKNSKSIDNNKKNHFNSKNIFYKNSSASSMKNESNFRTEISQNESAEENTYYLMK